MTARETILQGVREWLKACATFPVALDNDEVIVYQAEGVRPTGAYLAVKVGPIGREGIEERVESLDGSDVPQSEYYGPKRAAVTVYGYGEDTNEWLLSAVDLLGSDTAFAELDDGVGVSLDALPGPVDISQVIDTAFEYRFVQELEATFLHKSGPETHVELLTTATTTDLDGLDPTITIPTV
jgi:hypothetical protein